MRHSHIDHRARSLLVWRNPSHSCTHTREALGRLMQSWFSLIGNLKKTKVKVLMSYIACNEILSVV